MRRSMLTAAGALIVAAVAPDAAAQSLGAIRWQLAPYCNVLTLDVIQEGGVYRLQGYDDQCGRTGGMWSVVSGTAVLAPGNVARLGLTYTFPGGAITEGALIRATIDLGTFSGTWDDNGSHSGAFVFAPSGGSGGPLRDPATPSNAFVHRVTTSNRPAVSSGASKHHLLQPSADGRQSERADSGRRQHRRPLDLGDHAGTDVVQRLLRQQRDAAPPTAEQRRVVHQPRRLPDDATGGGVQHPRDRAVGPPTSSMSYWLTLVAAPRPRRAFPGRAPVC